MKLTIPALLVLFLVACGDDRVVPADPPEIVIVPPVIDIDAQWADAGTADTDAGDPADESDAGPVDDPDGGVEQDAGPDCQPGRGPKHENHGKHKGWAKHCP